MADDGTGLPAGFEIGRSAKSLGMRAVASLARRLGATPTIPREGPGTCFRLAVPLSG